MNSLQRDRMDTTSLDAKVRDFLAQKRIAVAGVSRVAKQHPSANLIYRRLESTGHDVFAVNPRLPSFDGGPCYPDVGAIPGGVDGVVVVTRPQIAEQIVRDCHAAGVPRVWLHQGLAKGTSVSPAAVAFCQQHGITVIAGACPMMFGSAVDLGHTCLRLYLKLTGGLPT